MSEFKRWADPMHRIFLFSIFFSAVVAAPKERTIYSPEPVAGWQCEERNGSSFISFEDSKGAKYRLHFWYVGGDVLSVFCDLYLPTGTTGAVLGETATFTPPAGAQKEKIRGFFLSDPRGSGPHPIARGIRVIGYSGPAVMMIKRPILSMNISWQADFENERLPAELTFLAASVEMNDVEVTPPPIVLRRATRTFEEPNQSSTAQRP